MTPSADELLARLRAICFDFGGVEEKLSHGAPFFHVRGKGFAIYSRDHHGDGPVAAWCKSTLDEQRRLVSESPSRYFVPPYVGVKGWVGVRLELPDSDFEALAILIEEAWRSVVPRRLEGAAPAPPAVPIAYPTTDPALAARAEAWLRDRAIELRDTLVEGAGGRLSLSARKKPYAYLFDNHHRDGVVGVCFRAPSDEAEALLAEAPARYYRPAYIGAKGWLAMRVDTKSVPWKRLDALLAASHALVSRKR